MTVSIETILKQFDADYTANSELRREVDNDNIFCWITQWDDWMDDFSSLEYKGQFDIIRSEVRRITAEMLRNPIEVSFRAMRGASQDSSEILQGMYRTDMRDNRSRNAVKIAIRNQVVSGYGAWRLITRNEDDDLDGNNQVIDRVPIHDPASSCIWDANAKAMDKADANHCTIITSYSRNAYEELAKENDWPEYPVSMKRDQDFGSFVWISDDSVYIGEHYVKETKTDKVYFFESPMGEQKSYYKSEMMDIIDELEMAGFEKVTEKKVKRTVVNKYLVTGTEILEGPIRVAGEHIPVVPVYGEWNIIKNKEVYEGVVRLAKDGQRLRNAILSFNTDAMLRSPRKKPFFYQEQIQGYEHMYESDAEYPYYLLNRVAADGTDLPPGAINYFENPEISQASAFLLEQATQAVKEVTTEGVDAQSVMSQRIAEGTVSLLNQRSDIETFVFQDNLATAHRRDGEIYASMAAEIYDTPREVTTTSPDGSEGKVMLMEQVMNFQNGQVETINVINGRFEVWTDVGPSYSSMRDQYRDELKELYMGLDPTSQERQIVLLQYLTMLDGPSTQMLRDYANKQLVIQGLKEPETGEEKMMLMQMQQQRQQPDPVMMSAIQANEASARKDMAMERKHIADTYRSVAETDKVQAQTMETLAKIQPNIDSAMLSNMAQLAQLLQADNPQPTQM